MQGSSGLIFVEIANGRVVATGHVAATPSNEYWLLRIDGPGSPLRVMPLGALVNLHFFDSTAAVDAWLASVFPPVAGDPGPDPLAAENPEA